MNIKNLFITSLISSVSFFLNILPVRAGESAGSSWNPPPLAGDLIQPPSLWQRIITSLPLIVFTMPIVIVVVVVLVSKSSKKKKEAEKSLKSKTKSKKTEKVSSPALLIFLLILLWLGLLFLSFLIRSFLERYWLA